MTTDGVGDRGELSAEAAVFLLYVTRSNGRDGRAVVSTSDPCRGESSAEAAFFLLCVVRSEERDGRAVVLASDPCRGESSAEAVFFLLCVVRSEERDSRALVSTCDPCRGEDSGDDGDPDGAEDWPLDVVGCRLECLSPIDSPGARVRTTPSTPVTRSGESWSHSNVMNRASRSRANESSWLTSGLSLGTTPAGFAKESRSR